MTKPKLLSSPKYFLFVKLFDEVQIIIFLIYLNKYPKFSHVVLLKLISVLIFFSVLSHLKLIKYIHFYLNYLFFLLTLF